MAFSQIMTDVLGVGYSTCVSLFSKHSTTTSNPNNQNFLILFFLPNSDAEHLHNDSCTSRWYRLIVVIPQNQTFCLGLSLLFFIIALGSKRIPRETHTKRERERERERSIKKGKGKEERSWTIVQVTFKTEQHGYV